MNLCVHTMYSVLPGKKLPSRRTVLADNRLLQQVPHLKKAYLNHICCCHSSSQVGIWREWNTINAGIWQRARPQYSSQEFAAFFKQWGIEHVTSSKLYPQSNGFIEGSVRTVKNLLRIAEASGQDPYLALLIYRSTPVDKNLPSPARLLNHRDITAHSYQTLNSHRAQLQNRQNIQRKQYDSRSTRELRNLIQGEQAVVFQPRTKTWTPLIFQGYCLQV